MFTTFHIQDPAQNEILKDNYKIPILRIPLYLEVRRILTTQTPKNGT